MHLHPNQKTSSSAREKLAPNTNICEPNNVQVDFHTVQEAQALKSK